MQKRAIFVVIVALLISVGAPAAARKRVVVFPFIGPSASVARGNVTRALRRLVRLVPFSRYRQVAERLKLEFDSPEGISQSCAEIRCGAVVAARIRRRGSVRYVLTLTVVGGDGKVVGSVRGGGRGRRGLARAARGLARKARRLIRRAGAPPAAPAAGTEPTEPQDSAGVTFVDPDAPPPRRAPPSPADEADGLGPEDGVEVPPLRPRRRRRRRARKRPAEEPSRKGIFDISAGAGLATRSFVLSSPNGSNRSYSPGAYSEFTIAAEFYPLALVLDGFARNIGLAASYSHHILVATTLPPNRNQTTSCIFDEDVSTSSQQLTTDLKLRWPLELPWSPILMAVAGFGMRDFNLGRNNVLPSFNYKFLRFGISGQVDLGTRWIALRAGGDVRPLLRAGQEAVDALGERSGGIGWGVHAGLLGQVVAGLFYFATFEYTGYAMNFKGLPFEFVRDCYPDVEEVDGQTYSGSDTFLRFWAGLGYSL
jgi:hypothetical protein